jgi:hypothetical protein
MKNCAVDIQTNKTRRSLHGFAIALLAVVSITSATLAVAQPAPSATRAAAVGKAKIESRRAQKPVQKRSALPRMQVTATGLISKTAVNPNTGLPLVGPIASGSTVKFIIEVNPPPPSSGALTLYPSITVADTMTAGLTYVPGSLQMPSGWTSTPASAFSPPPTTTFTGTQVGSNPGFLLPIFGSAIVAPTKPRLNDGYTPIVMPTKVLGIAHHSSSGTIVDPNVNSWNRDLTPQPVSANTDRGHGSPLIVRYAISASGDIYYPAIKLISSTKYDAGIGCYSSAGNPCTSGPAFLSLINPPSNAPISIAVNFEYGTVAGIVFDPSNSNDLFIAVNGRLYCRTVPAMSACQFNDKPLSSIANSKVADILFDETNARIYVYNGSYLDCYIHGSGSPCWTSLTLPNPPTAVAFSTTLGASLSPFLNSAGLQIGVCLHDLGAAFVAPTCFDNSGGQISTTNPTLMALTAALAPFPILPASPVNDYTFTAYRPPAFNPTNLNRTRMLYPGRTPFSGGKTTCFDFANPSGGPSCTNFVGWASTGSTILGGPGSRQTYSDYGYMADPGNPHCIYGLGHTNILFKFDADSGNFGCYSEQIWQVSDPATQYCDGKQHSIQWGDINIFNRPTNLTGGTIIVKSGSVVLQTITVGSPNIYSISSIPYTGNASLTIIFNPIYSGTPPTGSYFLYVSFTSDAKPQICYSATAKCGPVKNEATISGPFNGPGVALVTATAQVDLGSAFGPECPVKAEGLLKICKVAGPGVPVGQVFTFTAGSTTVSVPAGPAPGGFCAVGPFLPVGSTVTVTENVPSGIQVSNIDVQPATQLVGTPNLANGTVNILIGAGVTETTYTDTLGGYIEICKVGGLSGNYSFTVNPGNRGPFVIPSGACTPAIPVPAGQVVISEAPHPGVAMAGCSTFPAAQQGSCNLAAQTSTITVAPGGINTQTVATIVNRCLDTVAQPCPPPDKAAAQARITARKLAGSVVQKRR